MNQYIIGIDMDGTLINSQQVISPRTLKVLRYLNELGHLIVITSGRPLRTILPFYKQIGLSTPVISYNGSAVYGLDSGFNDYEMRFSRDEVLKLYNKVGKDKFLNVICETQDSIYTLKNDDTFEKWFCSAGMKVIEGDLNDVLIEDPLTMIYHMQNNDLSLLSSARDELDLKAGVRFWSGTNYAELFYPHVNKYDALKKVAEFYKIDKDHIITFGDAENDIELLSCASISVAMKNARDEIKKLAKYVTKEDNNHDGIALFLESFFKIENIE